VAARLQAHRHILSGFAVVSPFTGIQKEHLSFASDHGTPLGRDELNWIPSGYNHETFPVEASPVLAIAR
jgi:hypothetical protein